MKTTMKPRGGHGAAALRAKADAAAEAHRQDVLQWLELRLTMGSNLAARALGSQDMQMRHRAARLGIAVPAHAHKGPQAKREQDAAYAAWLAARKEVQP